jgi:hypothetical protein
MKLLFLDVDGVLNSHPPLDPEVMYGTFDRDKVARLNHVLRETGASIVLSSAWRYLLHRGEMNLAGFDWLLRSHGILAGRLLCVTRKDTMQRQPYGGDPAGWPIDDERGQQIADFLRWEPYCLDVERYAVVDDLDLGISAAGHPFVQTAGSVGLTDGDAARLIELLGEQNRGA